MQGLSLLELLQGRDWWALGLPTRLWRQFGHVQLEEMTSGFAYRSLRCEHHTLPLSHFCVLCHPYHNVSYTINFFSKEHRVWMTTYPRVESNKFLPTFTILFFAMIMIIKVGKFVLVPNWSPFESGIASGSSTFFSGSYWNFSFWITLKVLTCCCSPNCRSAGSLNLKCRTFQTRVGGSSDGGWGVSVELHRIRCWKEVIDYKCVSYNVVEVCSCSSLAKS